MKRLAIAARVRVLAVTNWWCTKSAALYADARHVVAAIPGQAATAKLRVLAEVVICAVIFLAFLIILAFLIMGAPSHPEAPAP